MNDERCLRSLAFATLISAVFAAPSIAGDGLPVKEDRGIGPGFDTGEAPMIDGLQGWESTAAFTVGETIEGYVAPGILDGTGILELDRRRVRIFVNHELRDEQAYPYRLANGTILTGARVSYFDFHRQSRKLLGAGLAYDRIVDRYGEVVTVASQINEGVGNVSTGGFDRFCSAWMGLAGRYGLEDDIYFAGEETANGQEFALDARNGVIHCVPALGRAAFESVTMIEHPDPAKVAFVIGDDRAPAPLLVYVGSKDALGDGSFLDRNGLARGELYVWVSDAGDADPSTFFGTGASRSGSLVEIPYFDPSMAGAPGHDDQGYADQSTQDALVAAAGGFLMSRPEDVSTNPGNASQAVLASTGRSNLFGGADRWGTTYVVDFDLSDMTATLSISYDGDDAGAGQFAGPDYGLRNPDNLVWAENGLIYLQEDRAVGDFGRTSGEEASIWQLDPGTGELVRISQVDRSAVPAGQIDTDPTDRGDWETSGIIDVTHFFRTAAKERLLFATAQAHSVRGGVIDGENLVQGGQLVFLSYESRPARGIARRDFEATAGIRTTVSPNPFNPRTSVQFVLPASAEVHLDIVDLRGRVVTTLVEGVLSAGPHSLIWDGRDASSRPVATGTYFYRLMADGQVLSGKMQLIR